MRVRALKTFNDKHRRLVRTGTTPTLDDDYARKLIRLGMVEEIAPGEEMDLRGPDLRASLPGAPLTKEGAQGNAAGEDRDGSTADESLPQDSPSQEDESTDTRPTGLAVTSSSLRQGRRSPAKTSNRRGGGRK